MKKQHVFEVGLFVLFLLMQGCKKDPVTDPNEGELITTVRVKLKEKVSGAERVFEFKDLDGEGGAAPQKFDTIRLTRSANYDCTLQLLNESVNPAEDITQEVLAEADDHQFYLTPTQSLVTISILDKDGKGLPLGIASAWMASSNAGSGVVNITLKHKPGKKAAGDLVSKGETDISLDFQLRIQ